MRHATKLIRNKRARVVSEVPDWEELRSAGHAIKQHTLRNLDTGVSTDSGDDSAADTCTLGCRYIYQQNLTAGRKIIFGSLPLMLFAVAIVHSDVERRRGRRCF